MNIIFEMSHWLAAEKESIDSKAQEWFDRAVQHNVSEEEALRNIGELIAKSQMLERVQKEFNTIVDQAQKEADDKFYEELSQLGEDETPEDGVDYFSWDDEEEPIEDLFPFPEEITDKEVKA